MGPHITLGEEGTTATHATSNWSSVGADRWLSDGVHEVEVMCDSVDNVSLFIGVVERQFWEDVKSAEEGEDVLPRDSKHSICMHGDGRVFIRGAEKDGGLMRVASGEPIWITVDFERGVVSFKLARQLRGKPRETLAEIPGLRGAVTLIACFGGRDQSLTIASCDRVTQGAGDEPAKRARDIFADTEKDRIAPIAFQAPAKVGTYEEQIRDVAATMESSM